MSRFNILQIKILDFLTMKKVLRTQGIKSVLKQEVSSHRWACKITAL